MAYRCDRCHKGKQYGHAVSHAKRRLRRLFKPNLQKIKVFLNGKTAIRVKFCTSCIKRLKKDGKIGNLFWKKLSPVAQVKIASSSVASLPDKPQKKTAKDVAKPLDIASIVGKKK